MAKASSKDRIDAVLGITGGKSVDDFLDSLDAPIQEATSQLSSIDDSIKQKVQDIDANAQLALQNPDLAILKINDMNSSLKEIEELVDDAKKLFKHVAENIMSTDLIDSEAVGALSKLLESIHVNLAEFISIYKDKLAFVNQIKLLVVQHQQKRDLILYKHTLDMEKIKAKNGPEKVEAENVEGYIFDVDKVVKSLSEAED